MADLTGVNEIDYVMSELLRYFLGAKVESVGQLYLDRDKLIGQKRAQLRSVLLKLGEKFPQFGSHVAHACLTLDKIRSLCDKRNDLVHGKLAIDQATKAVTLEKRGRTVKTNPAEINKRAAEANEPADELIDSCSEMLFGGGFL